MRRCLPFAAAAVATTAAVALAGPAPGAASGSSAATSTPSSRATHAQAPAVRLTARFGARARLGRESALLVGLRIDPRQAPATLTDVRILTPANLDIPMSALGTATCRRPQADLDRVRLQNQTPASCPGNALLGGGTADAELRFDREQRIAGAGSLQLFNGASRDGRPGLIVLVATAHPIVTQLVYGGYLYTAPPPYGLGMRIMVPPMVDPPFDATVALTRLQMTIGGDDIVYTRREKGHRIRYAPGGIPLPDRCPRGGFPFRAILRFDDGSRRTADTVVRCPRS